MSPMTDKKTADVRQGAWMLGALFVFVILVGYAVLPMFNPTRSKLIGLPAPVFTLPVMVNGEPGSRVSIADLRGKVVVLDFWASWCPPCRAQAPVIDKVARKHDGKGVVVLGVSTSGDDWAEAVRFAQSHNLSYANLYDENSAVSKAYRVQSLPTLVVLDTGGNISAVRTRPVNEEELESLVVAARSPG
jgi:cytochrome c biogenesis protein CcmG, thiol:disulfide interchange protein DsbE